MKSGSERIQIVCFYLVFVIQWYACICRRYLPAYRAFGHVSCPRSACKIRVQLCGTSTYVFGGTSLRLFVMALSPSFSMYICRWYLPAYRAFGYILCLRVGHVYGYLIRHTRCEHKRTLLPSENSGLRWACLLWPFRLRFTLWFYTTGFVNCLLNERCRRLTKIIESNWRVVRRAGGHRLWSDRALDSGPTRQCGVCCPTQTNADG
jgi:hypothetical protein